jgi:hypothetical protein
MQNSETDCLDWASEQNNNTLKQNMQNSETDCLDWASEQNVNILKRNLQNSNTLKRNLQNVNTPKHNMQNCETNCLDWASKQHVTALKHNMANYEADCLDWKPNTVLLRNDIDDDLDWVPNNKSIPETSKLNNPNEISNDRTFSFSELILAFKDIEKRKSSEILSSNDALKRFKIGEEAFLVNPLPDEKLKIESEIFPKLKDNPFLRNEKNVK